MQPSLPSNIARTPRMTPRTALVASADGSFRQRLNEILTGLRWQVREASGGAEAWTAAEAALPEAFIVDSWLPDLSCSELLRDFKTCFPEVALLSSDGCVFEGSSQKPHRQELLYALQRSQETDCAVWNVAPALLEPAAKQPPPIEPASAALPERRPAAERSVHASVEERLPEFVGESASMLEVCRRIRLVAPRSTPVLIEGPTGSGKELVAQALHRLSKRSRKPFVAINCAAIPEALLEAELFGHTRGAFTGAVQGRVGRIESADGGTLFLDEIGEMPLALQAKLLRFVESGELQRIGDNETLKVDVRILAAMDFTAEMRAAVKAASRGVEPQAVRASEVDGLVARPDGNDVSMDRESLNLADAQLKFKTGVALLREEYQRVMDAIHADNK